jgi:hypothetical protein
MPSTIKKPVRSSRRSNNTVNNPQPTTPIQVTGATAVGSVLTLTYDQVVALNGVPKYTTDVAGATATSAALTSPTTVAITFSAAIAAATEVSIPYEEPAVRNASGGFVSTSTFPV